LMQHVFDVHGRTVKIYPPGYPDETVESPGECQHDLGCALACGQRRGHPLDRLATVTPDQLAEFERQRVAAQTPKAQRYWCPACRSPDTRPLAIGSICFACIQRELDNDQA
jgi:hypothetical protein